MKTKQNIKGVGVPASTTATPTISQTTVRKPTPGFKDIVYCTGDPDIDAELFFTAIGKRPQPEAGTASSQISTTPESNQQPAARLQESA